MPAREHYAKTLQRIVDSKLHTDILITHEFALEDIGEAFEMAAVKKEGLKIVVKCSA
jgi:threonine dehydrogenase-like Zn-dependent dehydrogenase